MFEGHALASVYGFDGIIKHTRGDLVVKRCKIIHQQRGPGFLWALHIISCHCTERNDGTSIVGILHITQNHLMAVVKALVPAQHESEVFMATRVPIPLSAHLNCRN